MSKGRGYVSKSLGLARCRSPCNCCAWDCRTCWTLLAASLSLDSLSHVCMYVCIYVCMYVFFFLELRLVFAGHLGLVPQVRCAPSVGVSEEVYRHLLFRVSFHCIIRRIRFRETELLWCRWRRSRYVACSSRWSRWLWLGIMASECDL